MKYYISLGGYHFEYWGYKNAVRMYETDDHSSCNGKMCGYATETITMFYQPFDEPYLKRYFESRGKEKLYSQLYEICKSLCGGDEWC